MATAKQEEQQKILLGSHNTYLAVNLWQGAVKIHIRRYMASPDGTMIPTKKGIALSPDEFEELLNEADFVKKQTKKLTKRAKKEKE